VAAVMIESIAPARQAHGRALVAVEWFFTILFTVEYLLRLICVRRPGRYATSFFGLVDLCAVLPTYLSLLAPGTHYLIVVRILRVLRVYRVLRLVPYLREAELLKIALRASARKILVFLAAILALIVIFGSLMYVIEGEENGFTSIPRSIYWGIVTLTTVGYGDISPKTPLGQTLAACIMILGYCIIAVPTGIVTVELSHAMGAPVSTRACPECAAEGHDANAKFCKKCGNKL